MLEGREKELCVEGANRVVPVMLLAFLLPGVAGLGVFGVRWAVVASTIARTITYVLNFLSGRWKMRKL